MFKRTWIVWMLVLGVACSTQTDEAMRLHPEVPATVSIPATTRPSTTTSTTTVPATTTTVLDAIAIQEAIDQAQVDYGKCGQWHDLAIEIGWPEAEWPTLSYVLHRESRCNPSAHNKTDPTSAGSRGLLQINGYWCKPSKFSAQGWLQDQGVIDTCDDLWDAEKNLRSGLLIWLYGEQKHGCGWRGPWATPCR